MQHLSILLLLIPCNSDRLLKKAFSYIHESQQRYTYNFQDNLFSDLERVYLVSSEKFYRVHKYIFQNSILFPIILDAVWNYVVSNTLLLRGWSRNNLFWQFFSSFSRPAESYGINDRNLRKLEFNLQSHWATSKRFCVRPV